MTCGGSHLGFPIGIKNRYFVEDLPMIIPGQFGFQVVSEKKRFEFHIRTKKRKVCRGPSNEHSCTVWL